MRDSLRRGPGDVCKADFCLRPTALRPSLRAFPGPDRPGGRTRSCSLVLFLTDETVMMAVSRRLGLVASFAALFLTAASADARPITIAWDANVGAEVVGYIVYYGAQPGVH